MVNSRELARSVLDSVSLLGVAREARDAISGLSWFKSNWPIWIRGAPDGFPVPPLHLVRSATGISSLPWLFEGGELAAQSIIGILSRNGIVPRELPNILDFGCGCGRVIRHWASLEVTVHGSDYNKRAIRWCRRNLPFATFAVNGLEPPLPYREEQFDLVYALSVFTHLPETLIHRWMHELDRILKPGRFLVISTHGSALLDQLTTEQQHEFQSGRLVVKDDASAGTNRCGVYMSEGYIRAHMAERFRVIDFVQEGAKGNPPQDLVLLQKPTGCP